MTKYELREAMKEHFGSFGEVCYQLCDYRQDVAGISDNQIEEAFEFLAGPHRKCFNKMAFVASCREPS